MTDRATFLPRYQLHRDLPLLWGSLCLMTLAAPLHPALMAGFAVLLLALCLVCAVPEMAEAYVFLFLFDNVLGLPLLGGSLARVMQLGIAARVAWMLVRGKARVDRYTLILGALVAASCLISYCIKGLNADLVSFAINMAVFSLLRLAIRAQGDKALSDTARDILLTFVVAAVCAVLFGIAYQRFFWKGDTFLTTRFMGAHETNFTAMAMDVALLIWLVLSPAAGLMAKAWRGHARMRGIDAAVAGILLAGLAMTGSVTGLTIAALMLLAFLLLHRKTCGALLLRGCAALVIMALVVGITALTVRKKNVNEIVGGMASTGAVSDEQPNHIDQAQYRALHKAGEPMEGHLLTMQQWRDLRTEQALPGFWTVTPDASASAQSSFWSKVPVIGMRVEQVTRDLKLYGLDAATSGRFGLAKEKIQDYRDYPLWQQLIGRGPDLEKTYFPMYNCLGYSHNSYLDMLTGFGALGLALMLGWLFYRLISGRFMGGVIAPDTREALTYARVAILLHAAVLSMHLNRLLLFFFL